MQTAGLDGPQLLDGIDEVDTRSALT